MRKTMLRLALASALTAGLAIGLPATAQAGPATTTTVTQAVPQTEGGDWGWRRHHRFPFFGRFGFPIASPFAFGFGGFPCFDSFGGFSSSFGVSPFGFGGGGFCDC